MVGARIGGIKENIIKNVSEEINKQENYIVEAKTKYGRLLVDYSKKELQKINLTEKNKLGRQNTKL